MTQVDPEPPLDGEPGPELPTKRRPVPADLEQLLRLVSEGKSLRKACRRLGLDPPSTHTWLEDDRDRRQQYARAKEQRAEHYAEKGLAIGMQAAAGKLKADGARVALDAIKWATARMAPKTAPIHRVAMSTEAMNAEQRRQRIAELQAELAMEPEDGREEA